jgi:hypothetical protein
MLLLVLCLAVLGICAANPAWRSWFGGCAADVHEQVTPGSGTQTVQGSPKVYVVRGESFYHLKDCPLLEGKTGVPTALATARVLYQPCLECRPPG